MLKALISPKVRVNINLMLAIPKEKPMSKKSYITIKKYYSVYRLTVNISRFY